MKPYLWMQYPSATTSELSALIHSKWKALKSARKEQAGEIGEVLVEARDIDRLTSSSRMRQVHVPYFCNQTLGLLFTHFTARARPFKGCAY